MKYRKNHYDFSEPKYFINFVSTLEQSYLLSVFFIRKRRALLFALWNYKRFIGKSSTISVIATSRSRDITFGCSRKNALTYNAHYCGASLGVLNCMKNWLNSNDTKCAVRIRMRWMHWKKSKWHPDETCEIRTLRRILPRLPNSANTSSVYSGRDRTEFVWKKKRYIDRQYKRDHSPWAEWPFGSMPNYFLLKEYSTWNEKRTKRSGEWGPSVFTSVSYRSAICI